MGVRKQDPQKTCELCKEPLTRSRFRSGRLEDRGVFLRRRWCSQKGGQAVPDSTAIQTLRARAQKLRKAACERCGATKKLHAHHKNKNIADNTVENIETLCRSCHDAHHRLEALGSGA